MSKQCPGKYHGSGIKYINDNEEYCLICKQKMAYKKKRFVESLLFIIGVVIAGIGAVIAAIAAIARGGGGSDDNEA